MTGKSWCFSDDGVNYVLKRSEEGAVFLVGDHELLADFSGHVGASLRLFIFYNHVTAKNTHGL